MLHTSTGRISLPAHYYPLVRDELLLYPDAPPRLVALEVALAFRAVSAERRGGDLPPPDRWMMRESRFELSPRWPSQRRVPAEADAAIGVIHDAVVEDPHLVEAVARALKKYAPAPLRTNKLVHIANSCGRCTRSLTDPVSMATGYGPECRRKLRIETAGQVDRLSSERAEAIEAAKELKEARQALRHEGRLGQLMRESAGPSTTSDPDALRTLEEGRKAGREPTSMQLASAMLAEARITDRPFTRLEAEACLRLQQAAAREFRAGASSPASRRPHPMSGARKPAHDRASAPRPPSAAAPRVAALALQKLGAAKDRRPSQPPTSAGIQTVWESSKEFLGVTRLVHEAPSTLEELRELAARP